MHKKGSPTKITISQLPEILEESIKAQIEGFVVRSFIHNCLRSLFYIGSPEIQINTVKLSFSPKLGKNDNLTEKRQFLADQHHNQ